jgi:Porin subfamily
MQFDALGAHVHTRTRLLGVIAGLFTAVAAQAAELPVKTKAVQYVKICTLYGAGFYYIPGTQTCMKIGGFVRAEIKYHAIGSFEPAINGANAQFFRAGDRIDTRARAGLSLDAREQTEYGTLRAYLLAGWQYTSNDAPTLSLPGTAVPTAGGAPVPGVTPNGNNNLYLARAFVQYAGFTAGKAISAFDFFDTARYSLQTNFAYQDLGRFGINTFTYTAQFGNGWTASLGLEDGSFYARPIKDLNAAPPAGVIAGFGTFFPILASGGPTNSPWNNAGLLVPDIAGNMRVDQTWGAAQIMGALHDVRASTYNATANGVIAGVAHPADAWGWVVGAGMRVNLPSPGDSFDIQTQYCRGWSGRCIINSSARLADQAFGLVNSGTIGLGWVDEAFMANSASTGATQLQLPAAWNVYAGIQHYWIAELRTSLCGGYVNYRAESSAVDTLVCAANRFGPGCADWAAWQIGSRTLWNPVKNLDIGVDVQYTALAKTAFAGGTVTFAPTGAGAHTFTVGTTGVMSALLRIQRNFYP